MVVLLLQVNYLTDSSIQWKEDEEGTLPKISREGWALVRLIGKLKARWLRIIVDYRKAAICESRRHAVFSQPAKCKQSEERVMTSFAEQAIAACPVVDEDHGRIGTWL
jgi:hypothetical protein